MITTMTMPITMIAYDHYEDQDQGHEHDNNYDHAYHHDCGHETMTIGL